MRFGSGSGLASRETWQVGGQFRSDCRHELPKIDTQCRGELDDGSEGRLALSSLDTGDELPIDARVPRDLLLRQSLTFPVTSEHNTESDNLGASFFAV